jgi:hypothetical protein
MAINTEMEPQRRVDWFMDDFTEDEGSDAEMDDEQSDIEADDEAS